MTQPTTTTSATIDSEAPRDHHTCPPWIGRLLVSPLRRLVENPTTVLGGLVSSGATAVDVGCAMGYHTLDLARLVGPSGRVVGLDIQQEMLDGLIKRARRRGLGSIVEPRLCSQDELGIDDLAGRAELVTLYNVVHEAAYPKRLLGECARALKAGGHLLVAEPRGHVTEAGFAETRAVCRELGLVESGSPRIWRSRTALFAKP
jgi:ubiquinone/menaquinone biosynthesis C-methylase UbiE